jgi:hypothetical protein
VQFAGEIFFGWRSRIPHKTNFTDDNVAGLLQQHDQFEITRLISLIHQAITF